MNLNPSTPSPRFLDEIRNGWQSTKANVVPALVIVFLAAILVAAYYHSPDVQASLQGLQHVRVQWGVWFSILASAIGAGIIPGIYLIIAGKTRRGWKAVGDLLFTCCVWSTSALVVDRFYVLQEGFWGSGAAVNIVVLKMMTDQFVFTPILGLQIPAFGIRFRDMHYSVSALAKALKDDWLLKVTVPMLVTCWLTWIPGTLVVYSLPLPLQIPMFALIQCFFSLELAYASSKM